MANTTGILGKFDSTAGARLAVRLVASASCAAFIAGCARLQDIEYSNADFPPRPRLEQPAPPIGERYGDVARREGRLAAPKGRWTAEDARADERAQTVQPRVFPGYRDRLIADVARGRQISETAEGDVNLNFSDAEVEEAARLIFANILNRNYVVSPEVTGRVTFQTSRPLPREAVADVFDAVLSSIGATLIDRGDIIEILPMSMALNAGAPISIRGSDMPGFRLEIVPLSYVRAADIKPLIESIAPDGRVISVDEQRNILVIAGSDRTLRPLREAIALFDANWLAGMSFGVYPLENVSAEAAAEDMEALFASEDTGPGLAVRFLPVKRLNAVFIIAPSVGTVNDMINWLRQLDQTSITDEQRIFVYFAQNTKSTDLAVALNNVLTPGVSGGGGGGGGFDGLMTGDSAPIRNRSADDALADAATTLASAESAPLPGARVGASVNITAVDRQNLRVVAEETRNAILVAASSRDWRNIESILQQLDVPPLQVLLEVTVAEVTLNDDLAYGLQWFFNKGGSNITLSDAASGAVNGTFPGFSYVFSTDDVRVALDALSSVTDVDVISAPSLMVVNNQTARLQVGDQVPIAVESAVDVTNPDAPIVNSIQFRDTGVILKVTPRVNNSGLVIAEIEQEVSTVSQTVTSGIDSPTISQRQLSSTIAVGDGQAITLGGLIQDTRSRTKSGVPFLSDIPFLGALFRSTGDTARRTELLVILTPRVVRDGSDVRAVTDELRSRLSLARQQREAADTVQ